jgi:hypothetical protein
MSLKVSEERVLCKCCNRPIAVLRGGHLFFESRHGGGAHVNALTVEELRQIADELERNRDKLDKVA